PQSPYYGRGGWTWYTGSAQWLHRMATHWILGVRPQRDGLLIDPLIPAAWDGFTMRRPFRGAVYEIEVLNPQHVSRGVASIEVDGVPITGQVVPALGDGTTHHVRVVLG
ncbi:MAG: glycosyl transferase family 36, partial [Chloroflexus sp.]|nr:glycosyl transferase family 36 [Chloroflexus sp.]